MSSRFNGPVGTRTHLQRALSAAVVSIVALGLLWPTGVAISTFVEAKTPGKTYCYHRKCHRVMTLEETRRAIGKPTTLHASHYDDPWRDRFNPRNLTSSGEWFRSGTPDNAASPNLPNGTIVLAWNPATKQAVVLRINNAGPYWGNRTLDVSRGAAERLGFARQGVARLTVAILHAPSRQEATYRKGRRFAAVPGPIGSFASFELASAAASARLDGKSAPIETAPVSTITVASVETPVATPGIEPTPLAEVVALAPSTISRSANDTSTLTEALAAAEAEETIASIVLATPATLPPLQPIVLAAVSAEAPRAAARTKQRKPPPVAVKPDVKLAQAARQKPVQQKPARPEIANTRSAQVTPVARPTAAQQSAIRLAQLRRAELDDDDDDDMLVRATRRAAVAAQPAPVRRPVTAPSTPADYLPVECRTWSYSCDRVSSLSASAPRTRVAGTSSSNRE